MKIGLIKWFDLIKGFGVLITASREEYFLHVNNFETKPEIIQIGTPFIFNPIVENNKNTALSARLIWKPEDWEIIFSHLDKSDLISLEIKKENNRVKQTFSLIGLSLKYYFKDRNDSEIIEQIINYFDNHLEEKRFITYCETLESKIKKLLPIDRSKNILSSAFETFGKKVNNEMLFEIWLKRKFHFISVSEREDYEIPEEILSKHQSSLQKDEIIRITKYRYGLNFCKELIAQKFQKIEDLNINGLQSLYWYLELIHEDSEKLRILLNKEYANKIKPILIKEANELDNINDSYDLESYEKVIRKIPKQLNDEEKDQLQKTIFKIIESKCSDAFKIELWLKDIIKDISFEYVELIFLNRDSHSKSQFQILSKLTPNHQLELLKAYSKKYNFEETFYLLERFFRHENSLESTLLLTDVLFKNDYWEGKKHRELVLNFNEFTNTECSEEEKFKLFFKGYLRKISLKSVYQKINQLDKNEITFLVESQSNNKLVIKELLTRKALNDPKFDLEWLYNIAIQHLENDQFLNFDSTLFNKIEIERYLKLWEVGLAKQFPINHIINTLNEKIENYERIKNWVNLGLINKDKLISILYNYLEQAIPVNDWKTFQKQLNHIKCVLSLNENYIKQIKDLNNSIYQLILWKEDKQDEFNFEELKRKFIYFLPEDQVRIVRKLFYLKSKDKFDLTIEKLNELSRIDLDLYESILKSDPDIQIDISTDIVIKALNSFKFNKRFLDENEIMNFILNNINLKDNKRFKLSSYFENCLGRQVAKFNFETNGEIKIQPFGINQYYYAISFEPAENLKEDFDLLKNAVKAIPGAKWNPKEKHWGIPSSNEKEVLGYAKKFRFLLNISANKYQDNLHLVDFIREEKPNGIDFCEGRLANKPHNYYEKKFWWCGGNPCFSKCETIHKVEEWEKYTLLDFCEILELNTDEINKMNDFIPKGHYYHFTSLINRFNRLLDKLYCNDCNHILFPSNFGTSHFAAHTLVRFTCRNKNCLNKDEIYLNHCLNGQCNNIIDSRISKDCKNGLKICNKCGSCCSHSMLERRLKNLELTGGYIHDNLVICVNEKLGHLERAEYFCYKCTMEMKEVKKDVFNCPNCKVTYETEKFKFKRPHIMYKYKSDNSNNNEKNKHSNYSDF